MDETDWIATECCNIEDRFPSLQLNTEMEVPGMLVLSTFLCECCSLTRECPRAKKYPFPNPAPRPAPRPGRQWISGGGRTQWGRMRDMKV